METGIAWWSKLGAPPIYLIVDAGRVVACTPHAERWALGRTAGQLLERGRREGVTVEWTPLTQAPTLFLTHLAETHPVRRWRKAGGELTDTHLTIGTTGGGGFYLSDTGEVHAWRFATGGDCLAECRRRLKAGEWVRVNATYGPDGKPVGDPELPDGLSGLGVTE